MEWLQIIANIAQIIGVIWLLVFGGNATIKVVQDFLKRRPIRMPRPLTVTNVLLALILLALISLRFFPIVNSTSASTPPKETLTFPLAAGLNGATTTHSYTGTTIITVSGTGQAAGKEFSDAFYVYTMDNGQTVVTPYRVQGISLCINYQAIDHFVQSIPEYNPNHTYTFQITAPGGALTFGICDNGVSDNSGSFTVTLY